MEADGGALATGPGLGDRSPPPDGPGVGDAGFADPVSPGSDGATPGALEARVLVGDEAAGGEVGTPTTAPTPPLGRADDGADTMPMTSAKTTTAMPATIEAIVVSRPDRTGDGFSPGCVHSGQTNRPQS
jgi:hypothetical protein